MISSNVKKVKRVSEKTLMVAIDMGKIKHTGYCRCPEGSEVNPFDFFNNGRGFQELWYRICQTKKIHNLEEVVVGFESTGPYAEPLLHFLRSKEVRLLQVNPMHTKRLKELQGNSPGKTDHKDPKVIADIIELGHALTVIIPEGAAAELRRLTQARERSVQRRTALFNQLQDLVFLIFPEFLQLMKDVKIKSSQYILKSCPTPEEIRDRGVDGLTGMLQKVSRGKLGRDRAESLYHAAEESVGIKEGQQGIVFEIKECISCIEACDRFIATLEQEMCDHLREIPYSGYILSIKGIGKIIAAGLIGEVGDFRRFHTLAEIVKHAGLDLFEISSGKRKGRRHISKRGRPLLRKLLFFASINTVRRDGVMEGEYQRYIQRGMPRTKALIAIARKLLRIIFALVRNGSEFVRDYARIRYQPQEAA
jgi:transposase